MTSYFSSGHKIKYLEIGLNLENGVFSYSIWKLVVHATRWRLFATPDYLCLYVELYFICSCEFCQEQTEKIRKETEDQTMIREVTENELSKMIYQEVETRQKFYQLSNRKDLPDFKEYYTENSQKAKDYIECAKNLYNYGKDKKVQPICLYRLLQRGYCISAMIFQLTEHKYQKMFFEKEAIKFAKAAEKFEKILGNELVRPEVWKRRQINLIPGLSTMFDPAYSSAPQKMYGVSTNQVDWSIMK